MIKAEAHTDDHVFEVEFDATAFFKAACAESIVDLAKCNWGGDYAADDVAMYCGDPGVDGYTSELTKMFQYIELIKDKRSKKDECGFECHVDQESAMKWLNKHRPETAKAIESLE